jgi:hypothetical protein
MFLLTNMPNSSPKSGCCIFCSILLQHFSLWCHIMFFLSYLLDLYVNFIYLMYIPCSHPNPWSQSDQYENLFPSSQKLTASCLLNKFLLILWKTSANVHLWKKLYLKGNLFSVCLATLLVMYEFCYQYSF